MHVGLPTSWPLMVSMVGRVHRVGALVRKERLKQDFEAQALEDVICIVFLGYYAAAFAVKHDDEKLTDILVKAWRKMSPRGHKAVTSLELPPRVGALLQAELIKMEYPAQSP